MVIPSSLLVIGSTYYVSNAFVLPSTIGSTSLLYHNLSVQQSISSDCWRGSIVYGFYPYLFICSSNP